MRVFGTVSAAERGDALHLDTRAVRRLAPFVLALVTWRIWPVDGVRPDTGLDGSWKIGLHLAAVHGLVFGRDVMFTYGPLGFLTQPLAVDPLTGALSIAFSLLVWLALATVVFTAARRAFSTAAALLLAFAVLVLPVQLPDALVLLGFFATVFVLEEEEPPRSPLLVPAAGLFAALVLLVKLNDGVLMLVLFALAAWRLRPRRWAAEAALLASFGASVIVLWVLSGNPLAALPHWLRSTVHVLGGYSQTMASETPSRWPQYVWAVVLLVGAAAALALQLRRTRPALWLAVLVFVAAYLKEGFVRHDAHDLVFFGTFAVALLAFAWRGQRARLVAAATIVLAVAAVLATPDIGLGQLVRPFSSASAALGDARLVVDHGRLRREIAAGRAAAQAQLAVPPALVAALRGRTSAVVPEDSSAVWAYGLPWRPEPTFQDYAAYDGYLDRANARTIAARGPERLLQAVRWPGVDKTNPLLEAPATALARLCHYRSLRSAGIWTVLARTADRCGAPRPLGSVSARAGEVVVIPTARPGELVYARIRLRSSLAARLGEALFKPVHLPKIVLGAVTYRFVAASADDPLVLRLPATSELPPWLGGWVDYDRFTLLNVASPFEVRFYAVPLRGTPAPRPTAPSGRQVRIAAGTPTGGVEQSFDWGRTGGVTGSATDRAVAVYVGGRLAGLGGVRDGRFAVTFALRPHVPVRVFGIAHGRATELAYATGYAWAH